MLAHLAIAAGVTFWQWQLDEIEPLSYAFGLFTAFTVAVISHNHSAIVHGHYANLLVSVDVQDLPAGAGTGVRAARCRCPGTPA